MKRIMCIFGTEQEPFSWSRRTCMTIALSLIVAGGLPPQRLHAGELDDGLLRLAEILGSVHHLRTICETGEGALWRNKMQDLLDVEESDPQFRKLLISRFNDAYHRAESHYLDCTQQAMGVANTFLEEGRRLAQRLAGEAGVGTPLF